MPVYVDQATWPYRGKLYCHMVADTLDELHTFAALLGVKRAWFSNKRGRNHPHYDLSATKREEAITLGAIAVTSSDLVRVLRRCYGVE